MEHLETEHFKRYAERQLNADEMRRIVLHLDECRGCFDEFQKMFPNRSDVAREISTEIFTIDEAEHFHLDYSEHLKPFVDSEADAATREIVENHLQVCAFCAQSVRELREFSDSLQWGETHRKSPENSTAGIESKQFIPGFFSSNQNLSILSAAGILILILGGWVIWRQAKTADLFAINQPAELNQEISKVDKFSEQLPENSTIDQPSNLSAVNQNDLSSKKAKVNGNQGNDRKLSDEEEIIETLPKNLQAQIKNVIQTQKLNLPVFIGQLNNVGKLRGETESNSRILLTPNGQSVRDSSPILKWEKFANIGDEYLVTIYDKDFNQVTTSPLLKDVRWQVDLSLKRGEIYSWQVKSEKSSESFTGDLKFWMRIL